MNSLISTGILWMPTLAVSRDIQSLWVWKFQHVCLEMTHTISLPALIKIMWKHNYVAYDVSTLPDTAHVASFGYNGLHREFSHVFSYTPMPERCFGGFHSPSLLSVWSAQSYLKNAIKRILLWPAVHFVSNERSSLFSPFSKHPEDTILPRSWSDPILSEESCPLSATRVILTSQFSVTFSLCTV